MDKVKVGTEFFDGFGTRMMLVFRKVESGMGSVVALSGPHKGFVLGNYLPISNGMCGLEDLRKAVDTGVVVLPKDIIKDVEHKRGTVFLLKSGGVVMGEYRLVQTGAESFMLISLSANNRLFNSAIHVDWGSDFVKDFELEAYLMPKYDFEVVKHGA